MIQHTKHTKINELILLTEVFSIKGDLVQHVEMWYETKCVKPEMSSFRENCENKYRSKR